MKKLITIVFILLVSLFGFSQNKGKDLLNEVSTKVKGYDNISIDFKYILENTDENIKQETRGDVVLEGEKYKLNILGITRLYDGKTLYTISPEDEEVTITKASEEEEGTITPSKMLTL